MSDGAEALAIIFFVSAVMDAHCLSNARLKTCRASLSSSTVQVIWSLNDFAEFTVSTPLFKPCEVLVSSPIHSDNSSQTVLRPTIERFFRAWFESSTGEQTSGNPTTREAALTLSFSALGHCIRRTESTATGSELTCRNCQAASQAFVAHCSCCAVDRGALVAAGRQSPRVLSVIETISVERLISP
jgi:hypothetical protein